MPPEKSIIVSSMAGGALSTNNPPRGACEIAAYTFEAFEPIVLHVNRLGPKWEEKIGQHQPLVTGISVLTWGEYMMLPDTVAKVKKQSPKTIVTVGGKYPSFNIQKTLAIPGVDIVIAGYGDQAWNDVTKSIADGKSLALLSEFPGVHLPKDEKPLEQIYSPPIPIDQLKQPNYSTIEPAMNTYVNNPQKAATFDLLKKPFTPNILGALGCNWDCTFCINTLLKRLDNFKRQPVEFRPPEQVAEEVKILLNLTGLNEMPIFLMNPDSFLQPEHFFGILEALDGQGLTERVMVGIDVRIDSLFEAMMKYDYSLLVKKLANRLHKVVLAPETLHPGIQMMIGKETDPDQLIAALHLTADTGALPLVQIIVGFPQDSDDTLEYSLKTLLQIRDSSPPFLLNVHRAVPFPGTTMWQEAIQLGLIEPNQDIPDLAFGKVLMGTQNLTPEEVDAWREKFTNSFYSEEYIDTCQRDPRILLRNELGNSFRRSLKGEKIIS